MALNKNYPPANAEVEQERIMKRQQERAERAVRERRTFLLGSIGVAIFILCGAIYFLCCDVDDFGWWYIIGGVCFFMIIGKIGQLVNILLGRPPGTKF